MNKALLQNWIDNGYAVKDIGDGTWGWSDQGFKISAPIRTILTNLLYEEKVYVWQKRFLEDADFDEDGLVLTD